MKLRAFHNVCRHRAYTVVRRSCGTSNRFSCKYHGWQYDDQGKLVKAPQFEESPTFKPEENGLFEVKLLVTREGFVFVNFDSETLKLPFDDMKSQVDAVDCVWREGFNVQSQINWKVLGKFVLSAREARLINIAMELADQAQWAETPFDWVARWRKHKTVKLLGSLSLLKELEEDVWCTITLVPKSAAETEIKCDLYEQEGKVMPHRSLQKCKVQLAKEVNAMASDQKPSMLADFSYECGGKET